MDEAALIRLARKGDLDAFNRLVLAHQDRVFTQAYRVLGEVDAAEDATQEAFIAAYRKLHSYRGGSFRGWLLRIVTNACYDELRRRQRRPVAPLEPAGADDRDGESLPWMAAAGETPEEAVQRAELARAIQECLDRLPVDFRVVVVLVDVQGMDYRAAAEIIARPVGTVRSRLARARRRMQDCLQSFGELLPAALRLQEEAP